MNQKCKKGLLAKTLYKDHQKPRCDWDRRFASIEYVTESQTSESDSRSIMVTIQSDVVV